MSWQLIAALSVGSLGLFALDLSLPLGVAGGVPYVAIVLLSFWAPGRNLHITMALICSLLTVAGYYLSPAGGEWWQVLFNRLLALFAIWITAILVHLREESIMAHERIEARLEDFVRSSNDGVITINDQGIVTMINPTAENMFGYSADEVVGNNINMLMPSPYREEHDGYINDYFATGKGRMIGSIREYTGQRKDLSTFPVELSISVIESPEVVFTGLVRDVSDRHNLQQQLKAALDKSEVKYEDLVETFQGIIWKMDREGRFTYLNSRCKEILGYERSEMLGHDHMEFRPAESIDRRIFYDPQLSDGIEKYSNQVTYLSKSGEEVLFNFTAKRIHDDQGNVVGTQGTAQDVTEQTRIEKQLRLSPNISAPSISSLIGSLMDREMK